jgi:hypothetical protein
MVSGDIATLDRMFADDWVSVGSAPNARIWKRVRLLIDTLERNRWEA